MKKKFKFGLLSILFAGFCFTACDYYPGEDDYVTEQLASITAYDTSIQFKGQGAKFSNYALSPNVVYINDEDTIPYPITDSKVSSLVSKVENKMQKYLGYTQITDGTQPQLLVTITVLNTDNYIVDYYDPYWWDCDYYDYYWWDCGYYPYYPYYYPTVVGYYSTGTVFITMADLTGDSDKKEVVWSGAIRSLLTGTQTDADLDQAIDDCFKQTKSFQ